MAQPNFFTSPNPLLQKPSAWTRRATLGSAGLALAALVTGCGGGGSDPEPLPPAPVIAPERAAALRADLQSVVATPGKNLSSLAVVAVKGGNLAYQGYFGSRQIDNADATKNLPVNDQTKFRVASISKTITAIAVMQLVEQGKINLNTDASLYLPFTLRNPAFPNAVITPAMLLSHTGSIRDGNDYNLPLGQSLSSYFIPGQANYGTGKSWGAQPAGANYFVYSNLNYGVLASIIEKVSGKRFDVYMRDHLFRPLGINASFNPQDFADGDFTNIAALYRKRNSAGVWNPNGPWVAQFDDFQGRRPVVSVNDSVLLSNYVPGTNGTLFGPQGGLRISAIDLSKIMRMFLGSGMVDGVQILQKSSVDNMLAPRWNYTPPPNKNGDNYFGLFRSWGLGIQRFTATEESDGTGDKITKNDNLKWFGHLGDAYGLFSGMVFDPAKGDGMVYIIGGVGTDPDINALGSYSTFYRWEEQILSSTYQRVFGLP